MFIPAEKAAEDENCTRVIATRSFKGNCVAVDQAYVALMGAARARRTIVMAEKKLLFKGHVLRPGDFVKAKDAHSGEVTFYRAIRVWGHHGTFRIVSEEQAGTNPISITAQREVS